MLSAGSRDSAAPDDKTNECCSLAESVLCGVRPRRLCSRGTRVQVPRDDCSMLALPLMPHNSCQGRDLLETECLSAFH